jgi:hypothetical protein
LKIPPTEKDSMYTFQGYRIYQLHDANVSVSDFNDPTKARLVTQVDVQDGVSKLFNWIPATDPNFGNPIFIPELKMEGDDKGIRHTFKVTEDLFARTENKRLVNHKKYYFTAIAIGHNNYKKFDARNNVGQKEPFVVGRRNIGDASRKASSYEVMPRPIVDLKLGSKYGDGPIITRLDGVGNGGRFIDMSEETLAKILDGSFDGTITYKPGKGPIKVDIYNPLEVIDGQYELTLRDKNLTDNVLDKEAKWQLKNVTTNELVASDTTIQKLNEQVIRKYGFSVSIGQVADVGLNPIKDKTNGAIGSEVVYKGTSAPWLTGLQDDQPLLRGAESMTNFLKTGLVTEPDFALDPNQALGKTSNLFVPYQLADYRGADPGFPLLTPAWQNASSASVRSIDSLSKINNVDIVFTSDKSKWSRCVVVETAAPIYYEASLPGSPATPTEGNAKNFDLRKAPSVGKDAAADGKPVKQVLPDEQAEGLTTGMGWFPGYAVDVETGKRLNIFFGENSAFDPTIGNYDETSKGINRDMIWNPSSQVGLSAIGFNAAYTAFIGAQHYVYVTNTDYDGCKLYRDRLNGSAFRKIAGLRSITWAGMPYLLPNSKLNSYAQGLIPNDVTVKLRVNNPYAPSKGKNTNGAHPSYRFELKGNQAAALATTEIDSSLNMINVAPNPYYGYSAYEVNSFSTNVKITNLPAKSTVTIYTLDGKFIRQFKRDEKPFVIPSQSNAGVRSTQIIPDIEWDMKNDKGIPVASGVYLININSELGQRTLKFFAVNRQFDPSRL